MYILNMNNAIIVLARRLRKGDPEWNVCFYIWSVACCSPWCRVTGRVSLVLNTSHGAPLHYIIVLCCCRRTFCFMFPPLSSVPTTTTIRLYTTKRRKKTCQKEWNGKPEEMVNLILSAIFIVFTLCSILFRDVKMSSILPRKCFINFMKCVIWIIYSSITLMDF